MLLTSFYIMARGDKKGQGKKRSKSGYNLFMSEKRKEVLEKNPELKQPEVMKEVASLWKGLTDSEKQAYNDRAKQEVSKDDDE